MNPRRACEILKALVNGVDPMTPRELPKGTILENADVVRALLVGVVSIEQAISRESRRAGLPRNVGKTWSKEENAKLLEAVQAGNSAAEIASRHGRTVRAIEARLQKLGLITPQQRVTVDRFGNPIRVGELGEGLTVTLIDPGKT